jgi:hypothetical protein
LEYTNFMSHPVTVDNQYFKIYSVCTLISYLMATFKISFIFSIVFLLLHLTRSTIPICKDKYCGTPELGLYIAFPFQLREENQIKNNQSDRCGYPGFEVYCNNSKQALITLSNAREKFVLKSISFQSQIIWINGPNDCPPRRFLQKIDLNNDSPFRLDNSYHSLNDHYEIVTFLNCTNNVEKEPFDDLHNIPCLSSGNYTYDFVYHTTTSY